MRTTLIIALLAVAAIAHAQGVGTEPYWVFSQANCAKSVWVDPYSIPGYFDASNQRSLVQRSLRPISGTGHELYDCKTGRMWVGDVDRFMHGNRVAKGGAAELFHAPQAGGTSTPAGSAYYGGISALNAEYREGCRLMGRDPWMHLNQVFRANPAAFESGSIYIKDGRILETLANGAVVERELGATSALGGTGAGGMGLGARLALAGGELVLLAETEILLELANEYAEHADQLASCDDCAPFNADAATPVFIYPTRDGWRQVGSYYGLCDEPEDPRGVGLTGCDPRRYVNQDDYRNALGRQILKYCGPRQHYFFVNRLDPVPAGYLERPRIVQEPQLPLLFPGNLEDPFGIRPRPPRYRLVVDRIPLYCRRGQRLNGSGTTATPPSRSQCTYTPCTTPGSTAGCPSGQTCIACPACGNHCYGSSGAPPGGSFVPNGGAASGSNQCMPPSVLQPNGVCCSNGNCN